MNNSLTVRRLFLALGLALASISAWAQPTEAWFMPRAADAQFPALLGKTSDTLLPPFVDGFSHRLNAAWTSSGVISSSHWSVDPLSIGVAVFDGIAQDGQAYHPGNLPNDSLTDALLSPYFNLNGLNNGVLSFYLQEGGLGDPTESNDSLIIHFWNPLSSEWEHVWAAKGGAPTNTWRAVSVAVPSHLNGLSGVRFRIARYGSPAGAFDHFLLDYLEFGMGRNLGDTLLFDPAWSRVPASLIQGFSELPWWHYSAFLLEKDSLSTAYRRNGPAPVGGWQLNLGKYVWKDGLGSILASRSSVPVVTTLNHDVSTPYSFALTKPGVSMTGPTDFDFTGWFDGENVGELQNDSVYIRQHFGDRYALDDGSAERSYGVTQGSLPKMAQLFTFLQADSLRGLDLSFVPAGFDWSGMRFQLAVWEVDTAGLPGNILYVSDSSYFPELAYAGSPFRHYVLDTSAIYVPKEVYLGFIQTTGPALTVGLDLQRNSVKAYGDYAGWFPSLLPGTLMMRPFFRGIPADLSEAIKGDISPLYPNPASQFVRGPASPHEVQVYSALGQVITRFDAHEGWELPVVDWPAGMYIFQYAEGHRYSLIIQP